MAATKSDGEVGDGVKESEKVLLGDVHDVEFPGERVDPSGMSAPWDSSGRRSATEQQRRARSPRFCPEGRIFPAIRRGWILLHSLSFLGWRLRTER